MAAVYACGLCYMFLALAIVCDEFFVPALEVVSERLGLSDDIAGATFMAAGGSAPEFFTSMIGALRPPPSDVGIATIVGSAVFNVLFVIGACGIASPTALKLTAYPLARDSCFYIVHLGFLVAFFYDGQILWWEALIQFSWYIVYCVYMNFSGRIEDAIRDRGSDKADFDAMDKDHDGVVTREEARAAGLTDNEFNELDVNHDGGLDLTEVKHFLRHRRQLKQLAAASGQGEKVEEESPLDLRPPCRGLGGAADFQPVATSSESADSGAGSSSCSGPEEGGGEDVKAEKEPTGCCSCIKAWVYYILALPILVVLVLTVPDVRRKGCWRSLYVITFVVSIVWIAFFSYIMVYCAEQVGAWTMIDTRILALTLIASGTSVPDLLTSVIVTLQGHGDMAISSSIGSNIFDVTVGLPVPWLIYTLSNGPVEVESRPTTMFIQIGSLIGMLGFTVGSIMLCGWELGKPLGVMMLVLYVAFMTGVIYQIMQE
ncbi:unnamed protein product [Prorocentrum cordatum]|nr:unnamed protein product [Polarella glacialis]